MDTPRGIVRLVVTLALLATVSPGYSQARISAQTDEIFRAQFGDSDLTKPHLVDFYLFFPTYAAAVSASSRVRQLGLTLVAVRLSGTHTDYLLTGTKRLVPTRSAFTSLEGQLEDIATAGNGRYDGWASEVVR